MPTSQRNAFVLVLALGALGAGCGRQVVPSGKQKVMCNPLDASGTPLKSYGYDCEVEFKKSGGGATLSITGPYVCEIKGRLTRDEATKQTSFVTESGTCARTPDNCGATVLESGRIFWTLERPDPPLEVKLETQLLAYKNAADPRCGAASGATRRVDLHKVGLAASR